MRTFFIFLLSLILVLAPFVTVSAQGRDPFPPIPYQYSQYYDEGNPTLNITIVPDNYAGTLYSQFEVLKSGQTVAISPWQPHTESWQVSPSLSPGEYTWHARVSRGDNIGPSYETNYSETSTWSMELPLIIGVEGNSTSNFVKYQPDCVITEKGGNSGRALILLMGLNTSVSGFEFQEAKDTWDFLTADLEDTYDAFIYFSYNENIGWADWSYTPEDTYKSIFDHHVPLLHDVIEACRIGFGYSSFDLIGHSMGGVVALEYAKLYALNGSQAGWVKHIITLDSPINGSSRLATQDYSYWPSLLRGTEGFHSTAANEMAELASDNRRDNQVQINFEFANSFTSHSGIIVTITNQNDLAVPILDATILGYDTTFNLEPSLDNASLVTGHSEIFYSPLVSDLISQIVN